MNEYIDCYAALVAQLRKELRFQKMKAGALATSLHKAKETARDLKLQMRGMRPKLTL